MSPDCATAGAAPTASRGPGAATRPAERRRQRAAIAAQLIARAPDTAATLDWDALDAAPAWLTWPDARVAALQAQVGALLCAPELRLWIDASRLRAAARTLGDEFLAALLALPDAQVLPRDVARCPRIDRADQVALLLRAAGAGVLLASLPSGPLRRAAAALLVPSPASPMAGALAQSLVARAQALAAKETS